MPKINVMAIRNKSLFISLSVIIAVFLSLFFQNFPFNSWYSGWDNLHPEFNFPLNFTRALSSVWQTNQGLGTYGGHGYAATLPHTILLWIMSIILPIQYLRSSFTFICLLAGGLGVFFLLRKVLERSEESIKNQASLAASLFYLLNLATVQQFYIQLEAFIVHFAALPWLLYSLLRFLQKSTRQNLIIFSVISLLATVQGFIPPLFFVYFLILCIFVFFYFVEKPNKQRLKKGIMILLLTVLINSYYLLPVAYYSLFKSSTYLNAYNNLSSTQDFILKNKKYGTLPNVALLKGFTLDAIDGDQNGSVFLIFNNWITHVNTPLVEGIGYGLFAVCLLGLIVLIKKRENFVQYALAASFIICLTLLATNTPPFSFVSLIMDKIPILRQAFRVAFTKFSISFALFYALCLGIGIDFVLKKKPGFAKGCLISSVVIAGLIYFSLPSFQGYFLYQRTKIQIPSQYFKVFEFFNKQNPNGRIANFPQGWNWGWSIYKWGYSGSGFLWYAIKQPIMDRAFDVWGKFNENYYWELSYAIYSKQFYLIDRIMDKYKVKWVMLDENIVPYLNPKEILYLQDLKDYFTNDKKYKLVKTFTSSNPVVRSIEIYSVKNTASANNIQNIEPSYNFTSYDQAFEGSQIYYTDPKQKPQIYYPFRSLSTNRQSNDFNAVIKNSNSVLTFKVNLPSYLKTYTLLIPPADPTFKSPPDVSYSKNSLQVKLAKKPDTLLYDSDSDPYFKKHAPSNCEKIGSSQNLKQEIVNNSLKFTSVNTQNCYTIDLPTLPQRFAYLVQVQAKHETGKSLEAAVVNNQSKKADIDIFLNNKNTFTTNYIFIPPMEYYGLGYSLSFNNISIGTEKTVNDLKRVVLYQVPLSFLLHLKFTDQKNNSSLPKNNLYILGQSFDSDWHAYEIKDKIFIEKAFPFVFGRQLKNHVLVNNWENGWLLNNEAMKQSSNETIVIVYLPQYLEYLGFLLLAAGIIWVIRGKLP